MEQPFNPKESLALIDSMISKARNSYHDTGIGPIIWGVVIPLCSMVTWAQIHFDFVLPFDIWILTVVAVAPQVYVAIKEKKQRKMKAHDETMMDYLWMCFGLSIFLLVMINNAIIIQLNSVFEKYTAATGSTPDFDYNSFITSFFLLLYGFPTIVTGAGRNFKPMLWGGIICWICCLISIFTKVEADMLLVAFAAIAAWLIPGIIINKNYRKQKAADV